MKLLSLFSGIGAFEKALDRLGINYELVGFSEIDKYAVKSYCAIHGVDESMNLGDITKIGETTLPKDIGLITYGFPCQDISLAGKQKGLFNEDGTQTRSGLFFEALRIIEATQPRIAIAENVKNLTGKKFNAQFQIVLASLEAAGYNNYWKVLNAKDFGIPQNRERVFIVSIRKDIDSGTFDFPEGFPLELRLKDMLEDEVDEKYYLSDVQIEKVHIGTTDALVYDKSMIGFESNAREYNDIMPTLTSREYKEPRLVNQSKLDEINMLGLLDIKGNEQVRRVYGIDGLSPTLNTMQGGNRQPKVLVKEATNKGYAEAVEGDSINFEQPNSKTRRGRVGKQAAQTLTTSPQQAVAVAMRGRYSQEGKVEQQLEVSDREYANAITTVQKDSLVAEPSLRIRKLTPKECFRLMGFDDEDFAKAEAVNSNTQIYKQACNSIVVNVLETLLNELFIKQKL